MPPSLAAGKLPPLAPGEFRFVSKSLGIDPPAEEGGPRRFKMIASSTIFDGDKDEVKMSALEDLRASFEKGLNIFTDHKIAVDNVFGRTDTAFIKNSGEIDPKTGSPIYDLHVSGPVNEPNPRMVQLADSIDGGYVQFGASIGAKVTEHKRNKSGGMDIYHLAGKEASLVGIPANQRSWTYKAAKAAQALEDAAEHVDEDDDEVEKTSDDTNTITVPSGSGLGPDVIEALAQKAETCADCGHGAGCDCDTCDCSTGAHSTKSLDLGDAIRKEDAAPEIDPTPDDSEDGQEAEGATPAEPEAEVATPETASDEPAEEDDDAETAKSFSEADVIALVGHARRMAAEIGKLQTERDDLKAQLEVAKGEKTEADTLVEAAEKAIEKLLGMPLQRKAVATVEELRAGDAGSEFAQRFPTLDPAIEKAIRRHSEESRT